MIIPSFLLGIVVLAAVIMLMRWFATAPPRQVLRGAAWTGAALLFGGGLFLMATGRFHLALAALAGLVPFALRLARLRGIYRSIRSALGGRGNGSAGGGTSRVDTAFLRMTLDHASGALEGEVAAGRFAGRRLSDLSAAEALALWREVQADPQSARVVEAWLDRRHPEWREAAEAAARAGARPPSGSDMSRAEALEILGLAEGATVEEVKAAHHRLMLKLHPDRGGSSYLAAKINRAKDVLVDA